MRSVFSGVTATDRQGHLPRNIFASSWAHAKIGVRFRRVRKGNSLRAHANFGVRSHSAPMRATQPMRAGLRHAACQHGWCACACAGTGRKNRDMRSTADERGASIRHSIGARLDECRMHARYARRLGDRVQKGERMSLAPSYLIARVRSGYNLDSCESLRHACYRYRCRYARGIDSPASRHAAFPTAS